MEKNNDEKELKNKKDVNKGKEITIDEEQEGIIIAKKDGFNLLEVILIMLITLFFGALLGSALTYAVNKNKTTEVVEATVPNELKEFVTTYNDILNNYYKEIDSSALLDAGIEGMLEYLDDKYSVYMNKEEAAVFNQEVEGKYVGIGVEITLNYLDEEYNTFEVVVTNSFENGPAYQAGIRVGDVLLKIGDEDIKGLTLTQVSSKIKGESGSLVDVTVRRENEELTYKVKRREVEINSVSSKTIDFKDKKVGYIKIDVFASNTTNQFEQELIKLEDSKIDSLIIDVRDNSGGYLSTVTDIASMFLDKSKVIYQLDTKGIKESIYANTTKYRTYPVVMLINQYSASASEILTGAMLESYGADVVGVNSYGKGTVQKAYQLESGATIKYTIQKWLTPNGNWINETGITPTSYVEDDKLTSEDEQLQQALEIISDK